MSSLVIFYAFGRRATEVHVTPQGASVFRLVWDGLALAQKQFTGNDDTTRFYYPQGQVNRMSDDSSFKYYYTRDHLGSVRDVTTESGALLARFALIQLNRRPVWSARTSGGGTRRNRHRELRQRSNRH
jgi:hypothetical protein